MRAVVGVLVLLCCLVATTYAQTLEVPQLRHRITDLSGTLSMDDLASLEAKLSDFERQASNQIVVVMIPSLQNESIEDYALQVAEKNKLGKKEKNNGALLLIAKDDRKLRIEVGYGLEGVLTDALTSQIIRRVIIPRLKTGDYAGGINDGIDAIIAATKGEFTGDPQQSQRGIPTPFIVLAMFILFGFLKSVFFRRRHAIGERGSIGGGPIFWGGGGGFGGGSGGGGGFSGGGGSFGGGGASGSW